jgi:hypothetical protein
VHKCSLGREVAGSKPQKLLGGHDGRPGTECFRRVRPRTYRASAICRAPMNLSRIRRRRARPFAFRSSSIASTSSEGSLRSPTEGELRLSKLASRSEDQRESSGHRRLGVARRMRRRGRSAACPERGAPRRCACHRLSGLDHRRRAMCVDGRDFAGPQLRVRARAAITSSGIVVVARCFPDARERNLLGRGEGGVVGVVMIRSSAAPAKRKAARVPEEAPDHLGAAGGRDKTPRWCPEPVPSPSASAEQLVRQPATRQRRPLKALQP